MATVKKLSKTRWYISDPDHPKGRREVRAGTPGAVKEQVTESVYYIVFKEGGKTKRTSTGLTDKKAAQAYLADWNKAREHGRVGLIDPYREHLDRPIREHLEEYLATLGEGPHKKEVCRVLKNIFDWAKMNVLRDFNADKVSNYLIQHPASVGTRTKIRVYVSGFSEFLYPDRIPRNEIDHVPMPVRRPDEKLPRIRRSYEVDELRRLLRAAREYPLAVRGTNKGGRPRRDGNPAQPRKPVVLKPEYTARLIQQGKERELLYRLLVTTGLRRGEMSRVKVSMFDGQNLTVPKAILKVKPAHITHLVIPVVPTLAQELKLLVADKKPQAGLIHVPSATNLIREHKSRLKQAEIAFETNEGFADIHAMRTTLNMHLKRSKVKKWKRQLCLRHAAAGVTDKNYDTDNKKPRTMTKTVYGIISRLDREITEQPAS